MRMGERPRDPIYRYNHEVMNRGIEVMNRAITARLRQCEKKWQLTLGPKLAGGFRSEVFDCTMADDSPVVLKLMSTRKEAEMEALALTAWADTSVTIGVVDTDLDNAALLLERVHPATHLSSENESFAVTVAANILKSIHAIPAPKEKFVSIEDNYELFEQQVKIDAYYEQESRGEPNRGKPALDRLPAAYRLFEHLCNSAGKKVLLHGDFLDKNLLLKGSTYVAIDPIPMIGDPCSDIGVFAACHLPAGNMLKRAEAIARRNGENVLRAHQWTVIWAIHQAGQAWRDDQPELERFVVSEDLERLLRTRNP
ncbi:kinase [Ktedonobacter sp. SOSP1-85]|uniref:aminoglycoside phosphotransferase family protein n=1 Tax=Ktedonobacter sp. SOSP1-85 TaxID=2778367 RepID=UPI001915D90D|nr:aminoglycoside phosphotransferase family protein [Ktedonobacter sp. SOSP1-85]GHO78093.1 kinase [Ktedonobacter sp. SOSP1-85]